MAEIYFPAGSCSSVIKLNRFKINAINIGTAIAYILTINRNSEL
ncbi:hypothetical protein Y11_24151 [Yersinia enterocolitica subsp. palearctica Y11]|uniref:Uncharacterized protein n=1 Tax=Yersinia enterocolitica subsp. palearctica serotype O:3 (strain DSM 13030 / CIP 106945 / Y11) TaxID=930944 RepID=A0A0H3NXQ4_YERE1|nr:hypothetical protein Y11_24151 [Yersinia enterocolitica subsp. palearctica Y11]CCO70136.1 hypothetical protein D322_3279 [Yersinia enterocolitica IP 10393]